MASDLAVSHRLKELLEKGDLKITDSSDATVEIVVSALVQNYKEYQFIKSKVSETVQRLLVKQMELKSQQSVKPAVASLNMMISGSYSNNSSKRSRPLEDAPIIDVENKAVSEGSKADINEKFTDEPGAAPIKTEKAAPSTASKKRKTAPATRGGDNNDSINPLLVIHNTLLCPCLFSFVYQ